MTGLWIRTVIILSYMAFSPFDPQICPKSNYYRAAGNWLEKNKGIISEVTHTVLDIASFIPAVGTAASLINAGIYKIGRAHV